MRAATLGESAALRWMIEAGAELDARSHSVDNSVGGRTALMMAAGEGNLGAAQVLLDAGADPRLEDSGGHNALDWARQGGSRDLIRRLEKRWLEPEAVAEAEPAEQPPNSPEPLPKASKAHWRGIANPEADDVSILTLASPEATANALVQQVGARVWQRDAYYQSCLAAGRSFLVFRLVGHPWTVIRDAHDPSRCPDLLREPDAEALADRLDAETLYLDHRISRGSLQLSRFRRRIVLERFTCSWPGEIYDENDDGDDGFEPERDDQQERLTYAPRPDASQALSFDDPELFVHQRMRQLDAFAPSWKREAGGSPRLEIEGWQAEDFERIDFIALEPLPEGSQAAIETISPQKTSE